VGGEQETAMEEGRRMPRETGSM